MFFIYNPFHAHLFFSLVKVSVNLLSNLIPKHYLTCTVQTKKKLKSSLSVFLHQDGLSLSESYQATYAKLVQACLAWVQRADRVRAGQPMTNSHLHTFILCKLELSMLEANQIYKKTAQVQGPGAKQEHRSGNCKQMVWWAGWVRISTRQPSNCTYMWHLHRCI